MSSAKTDKKHVTVDPEKIPEDLIHNNAPLGAGRPPKALQLQKYEHVLKRLDGCIDDVMDELIAMIHHPDPNIRLRVCEMLLKRYIPEKKVKEIVGADGGPVQVNQFVDVRAAVLNVVEALDSVDYDELRRRSINGDNLALRSHDSRTES
jgi:hypothetical protein